MIIRLVYPPGKVASMVKQKYSVGSRAAALGISAPRLLLQKKTVSTGLKLPSRGVRLASLHPAENNLVLDCRFPIMQFRRKIAAVHGFQFDELQFG